MFNFKLEKEEVVIRGKKIYLYKPARLEDVFTGDPFLDVEKFPFWFKLWEASFILADYVATIPPVKKIIELGAGLGMVSLCAAAFGHDVLATDYQDLPLKLIKLSAKENSLKVKTLKLDWTNPEIEETFDLVIGAEIVFKKKYNSLLLELFKKLSHKGTEIILAHDAERKRVLVPFLYEAEKEFEVLTSIRKLKSEDGEVIEVILNKLIPKIH